MPTVVLLWVWFCAYLNCAGWALSAIHELNARGYAVVLLIWFVALCAWRKRTSAQFLPHVHWQKFRRRFRRPFPLAFLILAALAFLGGVLYPPTNYDALAYRTPRVLHWLAAGQWHWIHTIFDRLNDRSCGIEWVSAPFIALLKTDRLLFLINVISFLLLPGLLFSVFTRLGVQRGVSRGIGCGLCQPAIVLCYRRAASAMICLAHRSLLAAVDFALRAKNSRLPRDIFASILAAAMMTSAKTSNLPLLLPWAMAILPSLGLMFRRPLKTAAICALAVFASALPTMILNAKFSGDWSGPAWATDRCGKCAVLQVGANTVLIPIENFVPPVFPLAGKWNREVKGLLPPAWEHAWRGPWNGRAANSNWNRCKSRKTPRWVLGYASYCLLVSQQGIRAAKKYLRCISARRHRLAESGAMGVNDFFARVDDAIQLDRHRPNTCRLITCCYYRVFACCLPDTKSS